MTGDAPRRARADSAVSVIVPCFNHGVFLDECLASIRAQTEPAAEIIVVDDGSTEPCTLEVLERVEREEQVRVVRQANRGPSAARNRAVEESSGALVLPVDADNGLAPTALASMKVALLAAPERVRWVYPHQAFFGNRNELITMPEFNLWLLLMRNFCDTGSLIDRSVFEVGCRYREDIGLGHEDWDFFLSAAAHGFVGVPCHEKVLYVRKHGFTRSDQVNQQLGSFATEIRRLHPDLYTPANLLATKQEWAPALSVVVDGPATGVGPLLDDQTFQDFELVGHQRQSGHLAPLSAASPAGPIDLLRRAKGRWVLLWSGSHPSPLADPAFTEKAVALGEHATEPLGVTLVATSGAPAYAWQRCPPGRPDHYAGVLVDGQLLQEILPALADVPPDLLWEHLTGELASRTTLEWRSVVSRPEPVPGEGSPAVTETLPAGSRSMAPVPPDGAIARRSAAMERDFRHRMAPALHLGHLPVTRAPCPPRDSEYDCWQSLVEGVWEEWEPEHTRSLVLRFDPVCFRWVIDHGDTRQPPCGYPVTIPLGRISTYSFPGTTPLWRRTDLRTGAFAYALGDGDEEDGDSLLGFVSTAHLPGMVDLAGSVTARLQQLRMHAGGHPLAALVLGGPPGTACIDTMQPPPEEPDPSPIVPWPLWPLYELVDRDGRVRYATHPDAPALAPDPRARRATVVARIAAPGRTPNELFEAVIDQTGSRAYFNDPPGTVLPDGFAVSTVLGCLFPGTFTTSVPLRRMLPAAAGAHTSVPEPGHRLGTAWDGIADPGGLVPDGVLGATLAPDPNRAPLYRWRRSDGRAWTYTLGTGLPEAGSDGWRFDGTIGLAFAPTLDWPGLVDLVERRDPATGEVAAAIGHGAGAATYQVERVIARLYAAHEEGAVPVFRLGDPRGETAAYSINPDELLASDYTAEGPVAFACPAVPPAASRQPTRAGAGTKRLSTGAAGTALDGLVAERPFPGSVMLVEDGDGCAVASAAPPDDRQVLGWAAARPFPFCLPLFEVVERRTGLRSLTTNVEPALLGTHAILRAVAFVGSPASGVDASVLAGAPPAGHATSTTAANSGLVASAWKIASHLPPPAQRALRPVWQLVRPVIARRS